MLLIVRTPGAENRQMQNVDMLKDKTPDTIIQPVNRLKSFPLTGKQ